MPHTKKCLFKPMKYSSKSNNNSDKSHESHEELVPKGLDDTVKIDIHKISEICDRLVKHYDQNIKSLEGKIQNDFRSMISYVNLLYDTDNYNVIYDIVRDKFKHIKNVKPGTIGAYFVGCLSDVKINGLNPSCTPICTGSMPPSKKYSTQNKWSFCDSTVVWGIYDNNSLKLTLLNSIPNSDKGLLFVNVINPNNFSGLNDTEKLQLRNFGLKYIKILGYNQSGNSYTDITTDYVNLNDIKTRVSIIPSPILQTVNNTLNNTTKSMPSSNTAMLIIIIVVVLVVLFLLWKISNRNNY